jgi:branched-chain amino acid transport system ATP-binding protein
VTLLQLDGVDVRFGGLDALKRVSFSVEPGSATAVIGPNGAGKTTCFNVISGFQAPLAGTVSFEGRDITRVPPYGRIGIGRTFQIPQLLTSMTVRENVMLAFDRHGPQGLLASGLALRKAREHERRARRATDSILESMGLGGVASRPSAGLTLGQQRLVELARAIAADPRLLLLDEAASGLSGAETDEFVQHVERLRERGCAVLAVEHNMRFVSRIADRLVVLHYGDVIFNGLLADGMRDEAVMAAYLGTGDRDAQG